jgi:tRNA(Ile)-lysidine synthase TilS/MesJ
MDSTLTYKEWKYRHGKILESLPDKKLMVFFSGGKDSSLVLHFIEKASREFRFSFETHAGIYPHHVYSSEDRDTLDRYWKNRGVEIKWHEIRESDDRLASALAQGVSPCLVCNTAKKKELMDYMRKVSLGAGDLVIVMSYSLWDLVSATIEHTLGAVYASAETSSRVRHKSTEERFYETAQRFYPLLKLQDGFSIFKPLIYYNDQDIKRVLSEEGIPLLTTTCHYKQYRPKRLFAQYYDQMGLRFDFEKVLRFAQTALHLPDESFFTQMGEDTYLKKLI